MKVCEEIIHVKPNSYVVIVITGDGKREFEILRALSKKYDGEKKILWFRLKPMNGNKVISEKYLCPLKSLLVYPGKFGFHSFLFMVDKHCFKKEPKEELEEYIKNTLKISIENIEDINKDALKILCLVGSRVITIYVCIFGQKESIEENVKILIKHKLGIDVEPKKEEINKKLDEIGMSIEELIEQSSRKKLEISFPGLTSIFKMLEMSD